LQFAATGICALILNAADLENIEAQKCYYTLEIPVNDFDFPVFEVQNGQVLDGLMNIVNSVLPNFVPSYEITIPADSIPNSPNAKGSSLTYFTSVLGT
jgi:hypothetical protein